MCDFRSKNNRGFTLVELMVVMSIIGVLIAMLFPAVQQVRDAARRTTCGNNLRQIGVGLLSFEAAHQSFPAGAELGTYHAWSSRILPFVEQTSLYNNLDFKLTWDATQNLTARQTSLAVFTCPSTWKTYPGSTDYSGISGSSHNATRNLGRNGMLFPVTRRFGPVRMASITDGTSNTVMVGEAIAINENNFGYWSCGLNCIGHDDGPVNNLRGAADELASSHAGGAQSVFADGSTHFLNEGVALDIIGAICTRNNGEVIADF
ncbi:MAG: DUF1559 domain-containing protein [Planctomycetota bacterium]